MGKRQFQGLDFLVNAIARHYFSHKLNSRCFLKLQNFYTAFAIGGVSVWVMGQRGRSAEGCTEGITKYFFVKEYLNDLGNTEALKSQSSNIQRFINMTHQKIDNADEILSYLPDASYEQGQRFAAEVLKLENLERFFENYPDEKSNYKEQLDSANKALNYKQPYRIAVIGATGVGKSTMVNAMLGRDLVLMKDSATEAATGTVLEIFFDLNEDEEEKAVVEYRDKSNINQLINNFVKRYQLPNNSLLNENSDLNTARKILAQEPSRQLDDKDKTEFLALRKSLEDLIEQFDRNDVNNLTKEYFINEVKDSRELKNLIDEDSDENKIDSETRKISLVKSVTYRIKPNNSHGMEMLSLPKNVCLLDLPGIDGSPLHDIIIEEGIKDADAVIFIFDPQRIVPRTGKFFIDRVKKYILAENNKYSDERIFFVVNAIDKITPTVRDQDLPQNMGRLINELIPSYMQNPLLANRGGENSFFTTSARLAYCAQKMIKGEEIEENFTNRYESDIVQLNISQEQIPQEVLIATQVPKLVEEITKFAREHRIEGQINGGNKILENIIDSLKNKYEKKFNQLTQYRGEFYIETKIEEKLIEDRKALEGKLLGVGKSISKSLTDRKTKLKNKATGICNQVDKKLLNKLPELWNEYFDDARDPLLREKTANEFFEPVLGNIQIFLWGEINEDLLSLAEHLVKDYNDALEKEKILYAIYTGCYGFWEMAEIKSYIEDLVNEQMLSSMNQLSSRIAMIEMADPETYFTGEKENNGKIEERRYPQLFDCLKKIGLERNITNEKFKPVVSEIRNLYEIFVLEGCVKGLLNVYLYEIFLIEKNFNNKLKDIFRQIRNDQDEILKQKILNSISNPDWKEVATLQEKLAFLDNILIPVISD